MSEWSRNLWQDLIGQPILAQPHYREEARVLDHGIESSSAVETHFITVEIEEMGVVAGVSFADGGLWAGDAAAV